MAEIIGLDGARPRSSQHRYEADRWYFDTKERGSQAENWQVKVSAELTGWIAELIASRELPYRTRGDLARNGIMHEAHWAASQDISPSLKAHFELVKAREDAESYLLSIKMQEGLLEDCRKIAELANKHGTQTEAEPHLRAAAAQITIPSLRKKALALLREL